MKPKPAAWRRFERLVGTIERTLAPRGAVVRSPDHIRDADGTLRQIDASIRLPDATGDRLILIECRKRGRRQDKRWIEELVGKQRSLGAASVIAVASDSFSRGATLAARREGISLRAVAQLTAADVSSWCKMEAVTLINKKFLLASAQVLVDGPMPPELEGKSAGSLRYQMGESTTRLSLADAVLRFLDPNKVWLDPIQNPQPREFAVLLNPPPGLLWGYHGSHRLAIKQIQAQVRVWVEITKAPLVTSAEYKNGPETVAQHVQFPLDIGGARAAFAITMKGPNGQGGGSIWLLRGEDVLSESPV